MRGLLRGRMGQFRREFWDYARWTYCVYVFLAIELGLVLQFCNYNPLAFLVVTLFFSPILIPTWLLARWLARQGHEARLELVIGTVRSRSTHQERSGDPHDHITHTIYKLQIQLQEGYAGRGGVEERLAGDLGSIHTWSGVYKAIPQDRPVFLRLCHSNAFGRDHRHLLAWEEVTATLPTEVDPSLPLDPEFAPPPPAPPSPYLHYARVALKGLGVLFVMAVLLAGVHHMATSRDWKTAIFGAPPGPSGKLPTARTALTGFERKAPITLLVYGETVVAVSQNRCVTSIGGAGGSAPLPPVSSVGATSGEFVPVGLLSDGAELWVVAGQFPSAPGLTVEGTLPDGCNGAWPMLRDQTGTFRKLAGPGPLSAIPPAVYQGDKLASPQHTAAAVVDPATMSFAASKGALQRSNAVCLRLSNRIDLASEPLAFTRNHNEYVATLGNWRLSSPDKVERSAFAPGLVIALAYDNGYPVLSRWLR